MNMTNTHLAFHLSRNLTRRVLVIQPRRADGTFQSPVTPRAVPAFSTFHVTVNGVVIPTAR